MILIFGGTTEGKMLLERFESEKIPCLYSVATSYGREVLPEKLCYAEILTGRMDLQMMRQQIAQRRVSLVLDATHPYAEEVGKTIKAACEAAGIPVIRILREAAEPEEGAVYVENAEAAVSYLEGHAGTILLTTGSKTLAAFCRLTDYKERLYVRILPLQQGICQAKELGIDEAHLICSKGPFSAADNVDLLRRCHAAFLVTKESGREGGFPEKVLAARETGCKLIVIRRPVTEEGVTVEQLIQGDLMREVRKCAEL